MTMNKEQKLQSSDAAHSGSNMTHHHIMPLKLYFVVFGILLVLTVVTVLVSYAEFPMPWSIIVAMFVAIIKALLVAGYFMHLKYDEPYNRLIFASSIFFLALFFYFTFADLNWRGRLVEEERVLIPPAIQERLMKAHEPGGTAPNPAGQEGTTAPAP